MDVEFANDDLRRLYTDREYSGKHSTDVIKAFRKKAQFLLAAKDERGIRDWKSLHYERLKGARKHQWSIRLNSNWRLILEKREDGGKVTLVVVGIEDYH